MERWTPKLKQDKDGEYVLYTDHIAETRKLIDTYDLLISQEKPESAKMVGLNYTKHDLFDIDKNIEAGCKILKYYQDRTRTLEQALHLYSGGATNYAKKVLQRRAT